MKRSVMGAIGFGLVAALLAFARPEAQTPPAGAQLKKAAFAGGCFWCMQPPFDALDGVVATTVGYAGGQTPNPSYEQVSGGTTGHAESIEVVYDPAKVSYDKLLDVFWHNIDPVTPNAQFCDHGNQYRTVIFYEDDEQKQAAEASKKTLEDSKSLPGPVVTQIVPLIKFYPAEDYHQKYYLKNPIRYKYYRYNCGRDVRLKEVWGASSGGH